MTKIMAKVFAAKYWAADTVKKFLGMKEEGASAAEYALLLAIVTVGIAVVVGTLGTNISTAISKAAADI